LNESIISERTNLKSLNEDGVQLI